MILCYWLVRSDEQMSNRWQFYLLNDEQMRNWLPPDVFDSQEQEDMSRCLWVNPEVMLPHGYWSCSQNPVGKFTISYIVLFP